MRAGVRIAAVPDFRLVRLLNWEIFLGAVLRRRVIFDQSKLGDFTELSTDKGLYICDVCILRAEDPALVITSGYLGTMRNRGMQLWRQVTPSDSSRGQPP